MLFNSKNAGVRAYGRCAREMAQDDESDIDAREFEESRTADEQMGRKSWRALW